MSCIQLATVQPARCTYAIANQLRYDSSAPCILSLQRPQIPKVSLKLAASSSSYLGVQIHVKQWKVTPIASGCKQSTPACIFGGYGKLENDAEVSPWKSLEKAMSNLKKESSVEDLLRQQIQKQEFYDGGSGGENGGSGGDGGGSGGGSESGDDDGSSPGEPEDMSLLGRLDEYLQQTLAVIGFVLTYIMMLFGEDILAHARDMVKYLFTRRLSHRMERLVWKLWRKYRAYQRSKRPKRRNPNWLPRALIRVSTHDSSNRIEKHKKYARFLQRYLSLGHDLVRDHDRHVTRVRKFTRRLRRSVHLLQRDLAREHGLRATSS